MNQHVPESADHESAAQKSAGHESAGNEPGTNEPAVIDPAAADPAEALAHYVAGRRTQTAMFLVLFLACAGAVLTVSLGQAGSAPISAGGTVAIGVAGLVFLAAAVALGWTGLRRRTLPPLDQGKAASPGPGYRSAWTITAALVILFGMHVADRFDAKLATPGLTAFSYYLAAIFALFAALAFFAAATNAHRDALSRRWLDHRPEARRELKRFVSSTGT
ncbi:MAG: hypothetical protein ACHP7K_00500 [Actinomycetales bacterium]